MRQAPQPVISKVITPVSVRTVQNRTSPITVSTNGILVAQDRIDLFAEVTGIFEFTSHTFKPGSFYQKGDVLLRINSDEHRANIEALKSNLLNQIVLFLPDLKLDYSESFPAWEAYVGNFDTQKPLVPLPDPVTEKEKLFILGRGIQSTYHNISTAEERLAKYVITAPFSGVLTEALVNPGALVRNGQRLGAFINTGAYEMEVKVNVSYMDLLRRGKKVRLHNLNRTKSWIGTVARVDGRVDEASQTIRVFIAVSAQGLKEGMYLEADLEAQQIEDAFTIDRKLLLEGNEVYVVLDTLLGTKPVNPVYFKEGEVVVQGLADGDRLVARPVPGAFKGMRVEIIDL